MKKLFTLIFVLSFAFMINANGQNTVTIPHDNVAVVGENVLVPIIVDFTFEGPCAITLNLDFDNDVLVYKGIANDQLGFFASPADDPSPSLSYSSLLGVGNFVGEAVYVIFEYQGGYSEVNFLPSSFTADCTATIDPIDTEFVGGSVIRVPDVPLSSYGILIGLGLMLVFVIVGVRRLL